jgi:glycosyltransferase involved in cell wall biosynthesis
VVEHQIKLVASLIKKQNLCGVKILMLAPCLGKFGGIETFCLTLSDDLIKRGAIVSLLRKKVKGYLSDGSIEKSEREICSAWTDDEKKRFSSFYVSPRSKQIRHSILNCDLVHLHNPMVEGVCWAKTERKPCVMTIYNWRRKGVHPRLLLWKWAVANADRRWYISEFVWNSWETKRRAGSNRLPVVSRMPDIECAIEKRKGFLFIGRFIPNKGIRILLQAYHKISPDIKLWPLTLVGDGPLKEDVERLITLHNIKGVKLTGFVSEQERQRYTRETKWMIIPPHSREDLGLTPLEARSVSVPCIATSDGGVCETAGEHALFCNPGCVDSLAMRLKDAIEMNESCYIDKTKSAKIGLSDYVRSLDEYSQSYIELLQNK